ncbi:MAG: EcoRI family type II restriction endonuclease [Candidatus Moraniibacteriota bacterium]
MKKNQTNRLSKQHKKSKGPKGIFGKSAQQHDVSVRDVSISAFKTLIKNFSKLEFRYRGQIKKSEINKKLNDVDARLGVTLFIEKSEIKPDGGVIEVKDEEGKWRIILVSEAKHQGKDIENICEGILVGKNKDQDTMVAGNAIERSHKNINEIRNIMVDEKHFPYVLFLQGSNFLTESMTVKFPNGREVKLKYTDGSLNRIDRLTAANYSLPINQNSCENIFITINDQKIMLQAVSIYTKATPWTAEEMHRIMIDIAKSSLRIMGLIDK